MHITQLGLTMHNGSRPHIPDFDVEGGPRVYVHVCVYVFRGPCWSGEFSVALSRTKGNEEKQQEGHEQRREEWRDPAVTGLWGGMMEWVKEWNNDNTLY